MTAMIFTMSGFREVIAKVFETGKNLTTKLAFILFMPLYLFIPSFEIMVKLKFLQTLKEILQQAFSLISRCVLNWHSRGLYPFTNPRVVQGHWAVLLNKYLSNSY